MIYEVILCGSVLQTARAHNEFAPRRTPETLCDCYVAISLIADAAAAIRPSVLHVALTPRGCGSGA